MVTALGSTPSVEQEFYCLERPILVVDNFTDSSIEPRRGEQRVGVGHGDDMRIRAGGEQNAHHLYIRSIGGDDERGRARRVVVATGPRAAISRWTGRHLKIRVRAVSQQCLDELQLGFTIRNSANRIDKPIDRIRQSVFPRARRPMKRSEPRILDVWICPVIEQKQRERHVASHGRHEQRRAAAKIRVSARAESSTRSPGGAGARRCGTRPCSGAPRALPFTDRFQDRAAI